MRAWLITLLLLASNSASAASDYAREQRWAEEVAPAIVVGDPVYLAQRNGHRFLGIYTIVPKAKMGVVVVHGLGVNPDWGLIAILRQRLPDFGYATLSVQMPVLAADAKADAYVSTFPEAVERLQLAVAFLKHQGYRRIAIASHSTGSQMARAYMATNPPEICAWAALGMSTASEDVGAYQGIKAPVLDLYAADDLPRVLADAAARKVSLAGNALSAQVMIANTDHFYARHEEDMVQAVSQFLDRVR